MLIYLCTVAIYFVAIVIRFMTLYLKNRQDVISKALNNVNVAVVFTILISFVPVFRLVFCIICDYICLCSDETIEKLKNR